MTIRHQLLEILTDGHFHSGQVLGEELGVSRAAVWKQVQWLKDKGLELHSVPGRGYRLPQPLELLRVADVRNAMSTPASRQLVGLETHFLLDSTNSHLRKQSSNGLPSVSACLAECQTAGRGRRGRAWESPLGGGLYLSLLWRFPKGPGEIAGVSLVVGLAVLRALRALGIHGAGLKWPNDIWWEGSKLGGVLLDISGESGGPCNAVIGIGINVHLQSQTMQSVEQPWVDLHRINRGSPVSRNGLAGVLLEQLIGVLQAFEEYGLAPFIDEWQQYDLLAGRHVRLTLPDRTVAGTVQGIDTNGALMMDANGDMQHFASGEVTLRVSQ